MPFSWKAGLAAVALMTTTAYAAEPTVGHGGMTPMHHPTMQERGGIGQHSLVHPNAPSAAQPTLPGQDAFGAIQEVVRILEADPSTDWSKVDIAGLREHLIDMNEVTLRAAADERRLVDGVEIAVTGEGRTLDAIRRMVPAHARELDRLNGWSAHSEDGLNGVTLTVTTKDPKQVAKLHALGFMGLLVQGGHHQPHHLAMARGSFQH